MTKTVIDPQNLEVNPHLTITVRNEKGDEVKLSKFDLDSVLRLAQWGLKHPNGAPLSDDGIDEEIIETLMELV